MHHDVTFDRTTHARGRNGWYVLDHGTLSGSVHAWLELDSKRPGKTAPIILRFTHPGEMRTLGRALLQAATEWDRDLAIEAAGVGGGIPPVLYRCTCGVEGVEPTCPQCEQ